MQAMAGHKNFNIVRGPVTGLPQPFIGWGATINVAHVTGNVVVNDCANHNSVMLARSSM